MYSIRQALNKTDIPLHREELPRMDSTDTQVMQATLTFRDSCATPVTVPLSRDLLILGSGPQADVLIEESSVSPCHCVLFRIRGEWKLLDLYSRQGTRVNGQLLTDHTLRDGDEIKVGRVSVTFETESSDSPTESGSVQLISAGGEHFHLESGALLIGSWEGCEIRVEGIDKIHAVMVNLGTRALVRAVGETSTVTVNGDRYHECALQDEDELQFGEERLTVRSPHLPRRIDPASQQEHSKRRDNSAPGIVAEERHQITKLLKSAGQMSCEIKQIHDESNRQVQSLAGVIKSVQEVIEHMGESAAGRREEDASRFELLQSDLVRHEQLIKELTHRLTCIAQTVEAAIDMARSTMEKLDGGREWISSEFERWEQQLFKDIRKDIDQLRRQIAEQPVHSSLTKSMDELRNQVEELTSRFADFRSEFSQQLDEATQKLAHTDRSRSKELKTQRSILARQEEELAEERRAVETTRQVLESGQENISTELERQARAMAVKKNTSNTMMALTEGELRDRERRLQDHHRRLKALKNEVEIREARIRDQATQLIRLCQKISRLGDSAEGETAILELIALARRISDTIDQSRQTNFSMQPRITANSPL